MKMYLFNHHILKVVFLFVCFGIGFHFFFFPFPVLTEKIVSPKGSSQKGAGELDCRDGRGRAGARVELMERLYVREFCFCYPDSEFQGEGQAQAMARNTSLRILKASLHFLPLFFVLLYCTHVFHRCG